MSQAEATVLDFPRINRDRELKSVLEAYWRQEIDEVELAARVQAVRARAPGFQREQRPDDRRLADTFTDALRVDIEVRDEVVLVALAGSLDIYTTPRLRRDLDAYAQGGDQIVIDLSEVTFIDSSGLAALVSLSNQARRDGPGSLGLVCTQRHLLQVFEVTGLRYAFSFGPTSPASTLPSRPARGIAARGAAEGP